MQLLCSKLFTFHLTAKDNGFGCDKSIHCAASLLEALLNTWAFSLGELYSGDSLQRSQFSREKKKSDLHDGD